MGIAMPRRYDGLNFPIVPYIMAADMVSRADALETFGVCRTVPKHCTNLVAKTSVSVTFREYVPAKRCQWT